MESLPLKMEKMSSFHFPDGKEVEMRAFVTYVRGKDIRGGY